MNGIKLTVLHATKYKGSSSEDDDSDPFSDDMGEVEDVSEDATIEYPVLADASTRSFFIQHIGNAGLYNNLDEASGFELFAQEIGFNFDNSEKSLFNNLNDGTIVHGHGNNVNEQPLLSGSTNYETHISQTLFPKVSQDDDVGWFDLNAALDVPQQGLEQVNPLLRDPVNYSNLLTFLTNEMEGNVPGASSNKDVQLPPENVPEFVVVKVEDPVIEQNMHLLATSDAPALNSECHDALSEAKGPSNTSPSHTHPCDPLSAVVLPHKAPALSLDAGHVPDSVTVPQGLTSSSSCITNEAASEKSLTVALQRSLVKNAPTEDSYNETTSTDLSRESSVSTACRLSASSGGQANENDTSGGKNGMKENSVKTTEKKKKPAQTRRAHNSRAFKKNVEQQRSERESSSDEHDNHEWISNRPMTRNFCNNIDKFCNRDSRPRKPKSRVRQRKNASSAKPDVPKPISAPVQNSPCKIEPTAACSAPLSEEKLVEPVTQGLSADTSTLADDQDLLTESFGEYPLDKELENLFSSNATPEALAEVGLNSTELSIIENPVFDDGSFIDTVDENVMPLSDSTAVDAQPVASSTVPASVELKLPANPCKGPAEVINITDSTSSLPLQPLAPLAAADVNIEPPLKVEFPCSVDSDSGLASVSTSKDCPDVIALEAKPQNLVEPEPSPKPVNEATSPSSELPSIRPGSLLLAFMDSSGNLVPVSNTCVNMDDVTSAVAGELSSCLKDGVNLSANSFSELVSKASSKASDVKPDVSSHGVASSGELPEPMFEGFESRPHMDEVFLTSAPTLCSDTTADKIANVKLEPLAVNVKREVTSNPSNSDSSESLPSVCKVEFSPSLSPASSVQVSDSANEPTKSTSIIEGRNSSGLSDRNGADKPMDKLTTTLVVSNEALLSSSTPGAICKIPDYLQSIFEEKCEDKPLVKEDVSLDEKPAVSARCEAASSEACATDAKEKLGLTHTGSDTIEPSGSHAARRKINVTEYLQRKTRATDAAEGNLRPVPVVQVKQEKESAHSKSFSQALKMRPEMTNLKSMLTYDVPEHTYTVASQDSSENQAVASGMPKLVRTGESNSKVPTSKSTTGPKPKSVTDVSQSTLHQEGAQNRLQSIYDRAIVGKVNNSNANGNVAFNVKISTTINENAEKFLGANKQACVTTEAVSEAVVRVVTGKMLSMLQPTYVKKSSGKVEPEVYKSPDSVNSTVGGCKIDKAIPEVCSSGSRSSSRCSGQIYKSGNVEPEVCSSGSRSSSRCSGQIYKSGNVEPEVYSSGSRSSSRCSGQIYKSGKVEPEVCSSGSRSSSRCSGQIYKSGKVGPEVCSSSSRSSSRCSGQIYKSGNVEPEVCSSGSRSSSFCSGRGRKRDRSSSIFSSSCTSELSDSRRRRRHRLTSPSLSPIPLFSKKRSKNSQKRHKSRKHRRQSSSSSVRSRSPSYSRSRRRRRSFSPASSRSRSPSSDSYSRKKRSGKRSRYNSRSRSRSFSPNSVYSVGCACGGGDPKFMGHLPTCQHYAPDVRYPKPERPPQPQKYYHPAQFLYQPPIQYPDQPPNQYPYQPPTQYYQYSCYGFKAGPHEFDGTYLQDRRSETDAYVYGRGARPNSIPEQNLRSKQVEERLVVYVGRITENMTKDGLRERFRKFGRITDISLHFRDRGDNYGFITFSHSDEANRAIENGNKGQALQLDLCFGGRRQFCRQQYKDLDAQPGSDNRNPPTADYADLLKAYSNHR